MRFGFITALFALLLFSAIGCKKGGVGSSPTSIPAPNELIARINNAITGNPGDTTVITYNSDSSIHTATNVTSSNSNTTFYYSPGLVKAIASTSSGVVRVDSIVLNQSGDRVAEYNLHPFGSQYDFTRLFTYNTSGELLQMISFYPNMSGSVSDTVTFVWQNGDIISQTSTSHKADYTYTYDLSKPCQAGDIQYSNYRLSIGLKRPLNAHLCTAITDSKGTTLVNYNYDNTGRIVGYTATVGGNTIGAATYDYVP